MTIDIGTYKDFVIIIQATRGSSWRGDIAIDDISFSNCFSDVARNCTQNEVGFAFFEQRKTFYTDDFKMW